jgi:hypothetical protein
MYKYICQHDKMNGLDPIDIWLPRSHNKYTRFTGEKYHVIGRNLYEGTGLIIPKCGKNPYLNGVDINIPVEAVDEDCFDLSEMADDLIIEEIIASLCQFMTHYTDDICSSIMDYQRLYKHVRSKNIQGFNIDMIPTVELLKEIRIDRFPIPDCFTYFIETTTCTRSDNSNNKCYESQSHRLSLVNNFIYDLWTRFTKSTNGTLSAGYIPDYITQKGWNTKSPCIPKAFIPTKMSPLKRIILGQGHPKPVSPRFQHIMSGKRCGDNWSVIPKSPRPSRTQTSDYKQ